MVSAVTAATRVTWWGGLTPLHTPAALLRVSAASGDLLHAVLLPIGKCWVLTLACSAPGPRCCCLDSWDCTHLTLAAACVHEVAGTGITIAYVNLSPEAVEATVAGVGAAVPRHVYALTPNGPANSTSVLLNGQPLTYSNGVLRWVRAHRADCVHPTPTPRR